ncbi:MAG: helix-turn-helix domain-containing protein [Bacteroidales bacterium]|nr:helix-turn-helix domain-containing protein [Bacteroidales bacterium]MDD2264407.1 helix-turn-helix domain-containing protein [Bacteroidales bacterium]MDD2831641.1 helix-turn-helix domain-containing protein [Bacteroidales bacterium]MDD3209206.1 helix-turn-helix domain-containing protein [Bacteroidales bacterium]MDD3697509.1 helix-turn-helix domain-containing protein [Bacteroidales bacterium]
MSASVIYGVAASLLIAKVRVKAVLHFSPSTPLKGLIFSLMALGAIYFTRTTLSYAGYDILHHFLKEDYYLRIATTSLPLYCISFTSIQSVYHRKMLIRRVLVSFVILFPLIVVGAVLLNQQFTIGMVLSHFLNTFCLICILSGIMLFFVLNKKLKLHKELHPKEVRSFRYLMGFHPVISLLVYLSVSFGISLPARLFFAGIMPVHMLFINAIVMKDTALVYGAKWVEETRIPDSAAWVALEEAHRNVNQIYLDIYNRIREFMVKEEGYRSSSITRGEVAARIGTNITYVSRALNEFAGVNFKQFINAYRVKHAQEYFRQHPDARLIELCNESGFRSLTALNLAFRINIGMTPGEWCRMQLREDQTDGTI